MIKEFFERKNAFEEKIKTELEKSSLKVSFKELKENALLALMLSFLLLLGLLLLLELNFIFSLVLSIIIGGIVYAFILFLPFKLNELKARKLESEMPFSLLELGILLKLNELPEKALKKVSSGKSVFSLELRKALQEKEKGKSLNEAIKRLAEKNNSLEVKSFASIMLSIIESNSESKHEIINGLALNLIEKQKNELREYTSKAVMYSLIFIVFSALMPAFLLSFIVIGSFFIEINLKPSDVFTLITILFPFIDLVLLALIYLKMPESAKGATI